MIGKPPSERYTEIELNYLSFKWNQRDSSVSGHMPEIKTAESGPDSWSTLPGRWHPRPPHQGCHPAWIQGCFQSPGTYFVADAAVTPVQHTAREIGSVTLQKEVKAKIAELVQKGIIQKEPNPTEWMSSMVVVAKPAAKIRFWLGPRDLNKAIQRAKYQMPTLEETLPKWS